MNVLVINKYYYPHLGGIETYVRSLVHSIRCRVNVEVLAGNDSNRTLEETIDGTKVTRTRLLGEFFSIPLSPSMPWIYRKFLKKNFDIIHLQFPSPSAELALLISGKGQSKLVVTYHSDIVKQKFLLKLYMPIVHKTLKMADAIIATSSSYVDSSPVLRAYKPKCHVIPMGIDASRFMPTSNMLQAASALRKTYGNTALVLFVGRIVSYKGLDFLLQAMQNLNAQLIVVGEGPKRADSEKLAESLGVQDKVTFLGNLDDAELKIYYMAVDLLVLPSISRNEAFGIVQLEAMASGKPVISTAIGTGVTYVNQHRKTGIVVPPKDAKALESAIGELLSNRGLKYRFGANALERATREFNLKTMSKLTIELYESILKNEKNFRLTN